MLLDHRQLDIAGARRHIDDQFAHIAPDAIHQLRQGIARHRPAPCNRLPRLCQLPHRKKWQAACADHRDQLFVFGGGLRPFGVQKPGLRWPVDIGIDQSGRPPLPPHRDGEIGGQGRFADTTLTTGDRDKPHRPPFGCLHNPQHRIRQQPRRLCLHCIVQGCARLFVQTRYIQHTGNCLGSLPQSADPSPGNCFQRSLQIFYQNHVAGE